MADQVNKTRYYQFYDKNGKKFDVDAKAFDADMEGFAQTYPDVNMRMVDKNGEQWDIPVANVGKAMKEGGYRMWQWEQTHVVQPKQQPKKPVNNPVSPYLSGKQVSESTAADNLEARMPEPFEANYTYKDKEGNTHRRAVNEDFHDVMKREATPIVQQTVDQKGNVVKEDALTPYEPYEVKLDRMLDERNKQLGMEQEAEKRLGEVNKELDEIGRQRTLDYFQQQEDKSVIEKILDIFGGGTPTTQAALGDRYKQYRDVNKTSQERSLEARRQMLDEGLQLIREVKKEANEGDGVLTGFKQSLRNVANSAGKLSTWDFGGTDFNTQSKLLEAIVRIDNGDPLTDEERQLVGDWALSNAISANYGNQLSGWAKAGQVTGESLPFMLEMAINPASGLGQAAQKKLVEYATKRYGKAWVKNHMKGVVAGKIATRLIGDVLGGQTMAATTGALRTIADAKKRYAKGMVEDVDKDGNILFKDKDKRMGAMESFTKAWAAQGIENSSEMWGEYLAPVTGYFSRMLGKAVIGKAGREAVKLTGKIGDVSLNKAQRFIYDVTSQRGLGAISQGLNNFLKKTQWHGVLGEYTEEELGNLANAMVVGDMKFDNSDETGIFNLQQHIDTFNGVALMGGFMSALHSGAFAWDKFNNRMSKIDKNGAKLFSDWEDIKTEINAVIDDNLALNSTITSFVNNKDISKEQKKAVLDYTAKVLEGRGAEMAEFQPRMQTSSVEQKDGKYIVTSKDAFGNPISQEVFNTQDEAQAYQGELKMQQQSRDMKDYLKMSASLNYTESADLVDEFLGLSSGTWTSDEAQAEALAAIQDPNTTLGKQFQEFKRERILDKARASREAIAAFEEENGWEPGTVRELAESDPMELTDEELQMADVARNFLESIAYPSDEVHVEHEEQVGAESGEAVVEEVVSKEDSIDPNNNAGQQIAEQFQAAETAYNNLLNQNEDLAVEIETMTANRLSPQEIISSLNSFKPEEVQTVIDYFNNKAKFDGFMNAAAQKIDEVAKNSRERNTFKGTVNGNADLNHVHTITDGTNTYTLVSGNITTDSNGRITNSDSGLIIGVDANGDFVQIKDTDGYSAIPTPMTLDKFEEAERIRLQQAVTSVIDPNQTMNPAAQQQTQQSGILDNAGGEAGAANGTGANNPPATASVSEQPTTPAQPQQIPVDDLGVKLYEQGVPVDEAIDDMQADNIKDIPAYADLAINEAQEALDKIKQPKTRAEFAQNEQKRQQLQQTIDYWTQLKQRYNERYPQYADAAPFIQQMNQAQSKRKADEVLNAALQAGVNPQEIHPVHTQKVSDLIQKEEEARKQADEVTEKDIQLIRQYRGEKAGRAYLLNRNRVPSEVRRRKIAKLIYGDLFNDDFEAWNSVEELISMWLGKGRQLDPDTFGAELNWDMTVGKDAAKVSTMFAKRRENGGDGMLFNDFVHMVSEASGVRFDTQDVRNALIEMFRGAQEKSDLTEYQLANRVAVAEQQLQAEEQRQKEMEEDNASIEDNAPIQDGLLPFGPLLPGEGRPAFLEEEKKEEEPAEQPQQNVDDYVRRMNEAETHKEVDAIFKEGLDAGIAEDELFPTYSRRHKEIDNKKNEHQSKWQYNFHYDKDSGRAWIDRDDVSGPIPIGDGRWRIEGKNLAELRGILENPKNNLGEILEAVDAPLHNAEVGEQLRKEIDPIAAIETAAQSFAEEQEKQNNPNVDDHTVNVNKKEDNETENVVSLQQNLAEFVLKHPLTDTEIDEDAVADADQKDMAKDFLHGEDRSRYAKDAYMDIYNRKLSAEQPKNDKSAAAENAKAVLMEKLAKLKEAKNHQSLQDRSLQDVPTGPLPGNLEERKAQSIEWLKEIIDEAKSKIAIKTIYALKTIDDIDALISAYPEHTELIRDTITGYLLDANVMGAYVSELDMVIMFPYHVAIQGRTKEQMRGTFYHEHAHAILIDMPKDDVEKIANEVEEFNPIIGDAVDEAYPGISGDARNAEVVCKVFNYLMEKYSEDDVLEGKFDLGAAHDDINNIIIKLKENGQNSRRTDTAATSGVGGPKESNGSGQTGEGTQYADRSETIEEPAEVVAARQEVTRALVDFGYAIIDRDGISNYDDWKQTIQNELGDTFQETLGYNDGEYENYLNGLFNTYKHREGDKRMTLAEWANENAKKNTSTEQLEGDSAEFVERQQKIDILTQSINHALKGAIFNENVTLKTMQNVKAMAEECGLGDMSVTDLQELVEAEVVNIAREIANDNEYKSDEQKFEYIVKLYQNQPTLSARDNDRINKQQYSTPAPMAFLMGKFLTDGKEKPIATWGLEPSAGNGMLTINLPKNRMHVNDIDEMRLSNLEKQGFGQVTSQDALQPFEQGAYDVVVTNPPFGNTLPKTYDGIYEISGLEHQMAINALESMTDNGRAAIIIGGNTEYNQNGSIKGKDRIFLNYLYAHYNVVDVINMNGHALYSKQGTGYPVRMILINGRKKFDPTSFAPTIQKARAERVNNYDELYKRVNDDILSDKNKPASVHDTESGESRRVDDTGNAGASTEKGVRNVQSEGSSRQSEQRPNNRPSVQGSTRPATEGNDSRRSTVVDQPVPNDGSRQEAVESEGNATSQAAEERGGNTERRNDTQRPSTEPSNSVGVGQRGSESSQPNDQPAVKRGLGTEKVPYRKQSDNPFTLQSLMPAEQADVVKKALEDLGDVDQFLVDELGYSDKDELHKALAAEQIDSVAMAIHQMNQGNAFIIGDQTGIGKGRQAAALIRYGVKKGGFPVFITVKKALFSDMYRDLCDIGSPKLRPFIWSADDAQHSGAVTDKNGNVVYEMPSAKEQKRVVDYINKYGKLPKEYDYVLTTYDSFKSGTMDYEDGKKTARKFPKGKSAGAVHINGQAKRDALEVLAGNSYVIMDESHNAGGEGSNVSNYLQYITTKAKGLTFLSATFAKRPGNMPIYSLKTAISKAGVKVGELIEAVKRGGATFQEVMSKALTEAGQMIRRERDMTGVTIDWRGIEDEEVIQKQREQYDQVIGLFNDIINFQRTYVDPIVDNLNDAAADAQGSVDHTPGTRDMGINNTPFASRTYNIVQQVLLSLKAEETAKRAIEHLKAGRKPVITVANTNEGAADEVAATDGSSMEMPDLSVNLKKGLRGTLRITKKDAFGNTENEEIPFERLSPEGQARYAEIMEAIDNASTGLSLSPIDVIKNELKKAGYKIGELTGRQAEFIYNEDGTVKRVRRSDTDKKKVAADFNNGKLDALILNRSAGTGISLHASSTFKDQRQRIMIVAQAQGDVNDEVQIRGRIDRTGQVLRGMYEYVVSQIPSEQRLLMMLKAKLRSLDANTTSSQKSKFNEMNVQDIINKYGDDIVTLYLAEHPDLAEKMQNPLKWKGDWQVMPAEQLVSEAQKDGEAGKTASKVLGRMALLTVKEQEKMLAEISDMYQTEIDRLNEMGENDLEITEMPLKAKTLSKQVWEQGIEPGGKNPFADNTYVEKVNMDVLKKPMKGEEVKKAQDRLLDGKTWEEYKQSVLDKVNKWEEEKKAETTEAITARAKKKAESEQERYVKGAKKAQDKNQMTDEEIERNGQFQYNNIFKEEIKKLDDALAAIEAQKQVFVDALESFNTDDVYAIPSNIYDLGSMTFEPGLAKLIDVKISDNLSTSASTLSFATLDGRRKITIPISGRVKQQNGEKRDIFPVINSLTAQTKSGWFGQNMANTLKVLGQNLDNWDKLASTAARKDGYIITGNLLKALVSTREQGVGGKLISYTTDTGEVRQGILMPENFEPAGLTSKTPISAKKEELKSSRDKVDSADGDVSIRVTNDWDWHEHAYNTLEITVPKSAKKGAKYFNDEVLLSLIYGQFEGSSKMKAEFPRKNLDAVLKRLDELGVTVSDEAITTNDPMKAINQAANSWRKNAKESESSLSSGSIISDSDKNDVPLERRTMKSYDTKKDGKEVHHEGIEEELARIKGEISRSGLGEAGGNSQESQSVLSVNELRKKAARIRAEIARRKQKKQEICDKYNIDKKGNISLDDLARMFNDLNSSKVLGKLFEKVYNVLKNLGVEFRFTDNMDANVGGRATAFINTTFYNWDSQLRNLDNQEKARILLHEMIHNVSSQILFRFKNPSLGKLTPKQEKLAKGITDIYNVVNAAITEQDGEKRPYGLEDEHEMIAELANPSFREKLEKIPYNNERSVWQQIKDWFRRLLNMDTDANKDTALEALSRALDDILESYDTNEQIIYRGQRAGWEQKMRDAGYQGDYVDFWEAMPNAIGKPSIINDEELISQLESGKKETGYRNVVMNPDGSLGSPMADKLGKKGEKSKRTTPFEMGKWEQSDENPDMATEDGKIDLIKPDGKKVGSVDYNPYIHIRPNKLNNQFKQAWERPNLVYVETQYPTSELTSGYKADKAKKSVGRHDWNGGELILSRYDKPVRIVPWEEVADDWEREFKDKGVHFDIVPPALLPILAERGVEILPPHKGMSEECNKAYDRFKQSQLETDPLEAIRKSAESWQKEIRERDEETEAVKEYSAKEVYNDRLNRVETVFSEAYQDAMVSLKTAQNAIARDNDIPDSQNAYMAENLMHGKNKNEQDMYNMKYRDPLIDTINKIMNKTGMHWGDVDRYVYTKSGLERNREFFVRDWLNSERDKSIRRYEDLNSEEQEIFDRMAARIEQDFEDGIITEEQKERKLSKALQLAHQQHIDEIENNWIETKSKSLEDLQNGTINYEGYIDNLTNFIWDNIDDDYEPEKHDYSGFTEMYGDEDGKYDEVEILDELTLTEDRIEADTVNKLWEQIRNATRYGLERYREAGMRSDEQIDQVEQMFNFYVPMRGFKKETGEDMYQYFTGKDRAKSYVGGLLKHAKGRGSEANYPISTIFAMSYKAIADCNQNLVNQKFYRLCQANPNDLVILSDSWAVFNETTGMWEEVGPDIPEDASEDEVREITLNWEDEMRQLALENKAKKITGRAKFDYKPMDKKNRSEHEIDVRINGQPKRMYVTSNPRMAQALNGQLRFGIGKNVFSKWNAAIKNMMASLFTSYSPTFALRNMFRDWTHFRTMLGVREGHGYASQANEYYRQSLYKMVGLFKKYREGKLDESNEMEHDFKDFMDNGGITGFVQMTKIDDIQKQMEKLYQQQKAGKTIRLNNKLWEYTLGAIEAVNEGIENNARFATYRASRHYAGRTKARSAYDAKEITVNFNRKGAGSKTAGFKSQNKAVEDAAKAFGVTSQILGEGRIFFNATVQAIATTFKNFQNADGSFNKPYIAKWTAKYALPPFMFGLLLPAINKSLAYALGGDDDDPYANLPEWTRRKNICIYAGKYDGHDYFITIPVGQELAAFLALGDIAAGNTYSPDLKPVDRSMTDEMIGVMNTFSPVDVDTKITKGGMMEDPISESIGRTFSVLAPLVAVEQNLGWTGRPIYREDVYPSDKYNPEYQMVYQNTNPALVGASKLANDLSGGDDVVRGKVQVNPAIVQYLWEQYTGGPGKVFSNAISIGKDAKDILSGNESDFNIRKVEGLKAFVQQGDDRTSYYRALAKYRKYLEDAKKLKDAVTGYKKASATDPMALTKLEKISASEDFVRMNMILNADKELSKLNKAANKADGKERRELRKVYNKHVKEVVDMLDQVGKE